jgi:hypothetical protein
MSTKKTDEGGKAGAASPFLLIENNMAIRHDMAVGLNKGYKVTLG